MVLLLASLLLLAVVSLIQRWGSRHERSTGGGLTAMPISGKDVSRPRGRRLMSRQPPRQPLEPAHPRARLPALLLLAPLVMIFFKTFEDGLAPPLDAITSPDGMHALKLTLLMVAIAVPLNTIFGVVCALLLVRHKWKGNCRDRRGRSTCRSRSRRS